MTSAVDFFAEFAIDETKAVDGVMVPYKDGVNLCIARSGNRSYRKIAQALYAKNERVLKAGGEAAEDKLNEIIVEAMAKAILVGWEGPLTYQGEALPYNHENAKKLLRHERFLNWTDAQSKDEDKYKAVQAEEEGKN